PAGAGAPARSGDRGTDAVPPGAGRERGSGGLRSAGVRPLLAAAAAVALAARIGFRPDRYQEHAGGQVARHGDAAGAAVAYQLGTAGRPDALAHGAVRAHGAAPAPHRATG